MRLEDMDENDYRMRSFTPQARAAWRNYEAAAEDCDEVICMSCKRWQFVDAGESCFIGRCEVTKKKTEHNKTCDEWSGE